MTDEQAEAAYAMINEERELIEEELAKVAGGMCWRDCDELGVHDMGYYE